MANTVAARDSMSYYAPEDCAWCKSTGEFGDAPCPACNGKGYVLALQPAITCAACTGTGRPLWLVGTKAADERCPVCGGSGWLIKELTWVKSCFV